MKTRKTLWIPKVLWGCSGVSSYNSSCWLSLIETLDIYGAPERDPYANPILHPKLKDLPKSYITGCGQDTLRDDARLMRDALKQAGVPVRFDEYDGYPHYFWTFPGPSLEEPTRDYYEKLEQGVKFVLSSSASIWDCQVEAFLLIIAAVYTITRIKLQELLNSSDWLLRQNDWDVSIPYYYVKHQSFGQFPWLYV